VENDGNEEEETVLNNEALVGITIMMYRVVIIFGRA
jgi:hypothetical protein